MTATTPSATGRCPITGGAAERFDPFGMEYQLNPGEALKWARENEPIFFDDKLGYWVVTRYEDVQEVFRDNATYSPSVALEKITPPTEEAAAILEEHEFALGRTLVNEDEPDHTLRRRALAGAFDTKHLAGHEDMVRELVRSHMDQFIDAGRVDLVDGLLWEVPLTVAFHFLGVPEHDMQLLREYSIAHTVNTWGRPSPEEQAEVARSVGKFWQLAGEILAELRTTPNAPGWMPMSIRAQQEQPDVVTDSYLHSMMMAGIVAAHETTAHSGANGIKLLLENREVWQRICEEPTLIPNAIEECLRLSGGVAAWRRITTRPTTLGGIRLPEGARILMISAAANRDPEMFPDPDVIDLHRDNMAKHLTFGYGSHQCLGKNLARLELQVILQELTTRLPHMRLDDEQEFSFVANTSFRGPEHLWVTWDPTQNPERLGQAQTERPTIVFNGPSRDLRTRTMTVTAVEPNGEGTRLIRMEPSGGETLPTYWPGAHIEIEVNGQNRHYSLCGSNPEVWEISVAVDPHGRGGSRWIHDNVTVGSELRVRGPRSNFRIDPHATHVIFVAGGIGITPLLAMADQAQRAGLDYPLHYCGRSRRSMAYLDRLERDHGAHLELHVSDEGSRFDVASLAEHQSPTVQVVTCGPSRLTDAVCAALSEWPEGSVIRESFTASAGIDTAANEPFDVVINSTGHTTRVPAESTLLEHLESEGYDLHADCREGLCGTCEVGVLSGTPEHRDLLLTARERAAGGRILPCVSRGKGAQPLTLDL